MAYPPLHAYPPHVPALWEQAADKPPLRIPCTTRREAEALRFRLTGWRSRARDLSHTPNPHLTEDDQMASLALAGRVQRHTVHVDQGADGQWFVELRDGVAPYTLLRPSWLREQEARLQDLFTSTRQSD